VKVAASGKTMTYAAAQLWINSLKHWSNGFTRNFQTEKGNKGSRKPVDE
jgi:hypothetical protein